DSSSARDERGPHSGELPPPMVSNLGRGSPHLNSAVMWLFTRDSYCSIVRHSDNPNQLLVRARQEDDIQRLWPDARIEATPDADYPFRAAIDEHDVVSAVGVALRAIRYTTDFKGGVT